MTSSLWYYYYYIYISLLMCFVFCLNKQQTFHFCFLDVFRTCGKMFCTEVIKTSPHAKRKVHQKTTQLPPCCQEATITPTVRKLHCLPFLYLLTMHKVKISKLYVPCQFCLSTHAKSFQYLLFTSSENSFLDCDFSCQETWELDSERHCVRKPRSHSNNCFSGTPKESKTFPPSMTK